MQSSDAHLASLRERFGSVFAARATEGKPDAAGFAGLFGSPMRIVPALSDTEKPAACHITSAQHLPMAAHALHARARSSRTNICDPFVAK